MIFVDELDALAGSRENELHEATRRMLSVLLRRMDGLDASAQTALMYIRSLQHPFSKISHQTDLHETAAAFVPALINYRADTLSSQKWDP